MRAASGDEVGALATALCTMVERVREAVAQLTTQAKELTIARDGADTANRAKSSFLANMSHEIRTPMNAVLGMLEIVLDTELTAEQRRSLDTVRLSAETLLTILNDVLDFSKIEAEHIELEQIGFDLHRTVHATVSLLAVRADEKGLELVAEIAPDVPQFVRGDPTRVRQVLTNLIGNAIKFTEAGEVVVSASLVADHDARAQIRFRVRDTGIGIAADKLGLVFQEFTQADASMTRRFGGTGLGLAISRRLVTLMGGELTVTSELGRGSEFAFTLPLPVDAAPVHPSRPGTMSFQGQRVLIVDDNATNRRILHELLAGDGMVVGEAGGATEALDALRRAERPYEFAIIDAQMPGTDGFGLAAAVQADPRLAVTRLVMLTSAGQRGDGERCRQLGIRGYLNKPIARSDLLEVLALLLAPPVAPAAPTPGPEVITRHTIAESRRTLRILLAEDNPVNQQVAATMLRKRGHVVDIVADGRQAVDAVRARGYDILLMDVQMPGAARPRRADRGPHGARAGRRPRTLPRRWHERVSHEAVQGARPVCHRGKMDRSGSADPGGVRADDRGSGPGRPGRLPREHAGRRLGRRRGWNPGHVPRGCPRARGGAGRRGERRGRGRDRPGGTCLQVGRRLDWSASPRHDTPRDGGVRRGRRARHRPRRARPRTPRSRGSGALPPLRAGREKPSCLRP